MINTTVIKKIAETTVQERVAVVAYQDAAVHAEAAVAVVAEVVEEEGTNQNKK
jgi:hypothetical protein